MGLSMTIVSISIYRETFEETESRFLVGSRVLIALRVDKIISAPVCLNNAIIFAIANVSND